MKIEIPPFRAMARCNEHLNHNGFFIDLGEDVVQVVRCKDCVLNGKCMVQDHFTFCGLTNPFCCVGAREIEE